MASPLIVDLDTIDFSNVQIPIEEIRKFNAQRFEMEQLHGIICFDREKNYIVGYRDVGDDEFWVRGHIPGRPLMPGVLIVEAAAQLSTYFYKVAIDDDPGRFLGFGGLDRVKFRGTVKPGDRLILLGRALEIKKRMATFETQGVVNGKLVFEGTIIGVPV